MVGRKKKPAAQQKLEGRKAHKEPKQDAATGTIPSWVGAHGQKFLKEHGARIRLELGVKAADEPMLFAMAAAYGNMVAAQESINKRGFEVKDRVAGIFRKNPLSSEVRAYGQLFTQIATQFGMSPVARLRLMQPETKDDGDAILDGRAQRVPDWKPVTGGVQ